MTLLDDLIQGGWLKTPRIIEAFKKIKRIDFLPQGLKDLAELNEALSIGFGQTISQPLTVAFMFEKLQPNLGERILDIGAGSGWTTALLGEIVGREGRVIGIEILPELKEFGQGNVSKYNFIDKGIVKFVCHDGSLGYSKEAPFDKILCSAAVRWRREGYDRREVAPQDRIPVAWGEQLKIGGKIVTPINSSIWVFEKKSAKEFIATEYPGFVFVPLVEK